MVVFVRVFLLVGRRFVAGSVGSEVTVVVRFLQYVFVFVLDLLDSSGLFLFLGGGILPLVFVNRLVGCVENILVQLGWGMAHQEEGLESHTTGLWPCRRMKAQQVPEQGLCIWDEALIRTPTGLVLKQDVLRMVGEDLIPVNSIYEMSVKTFISPLYIVCYAQGSIVSPKAYRVVRQGRDPKNIIYTMHPKLNTSIAYV